MHEPTFHIGEVASRAGLSLRTVRYYESIGLVIPSGRTEGGFRLYTEPDVQRLLLVRALKPAEFTPDELVELIELRDRLLTTRPEDPGRAIARSRFDGLLGIATLRLRLQRERLIAAELAMELLRGVIGDDPSGAATT